ncbi:MAG: hypothetical protein CVU69_05980 [Deltaproteobacteria bacterium HGW-Deltaproteobacteria-4]|nr:MAG: hypothetical protein CVU69_05980 [Deltaproteobacteria bacterium HGW-Deltaproteobacteria-4]
MQRRILFSLLLLGAGVATALAGEILRIDDFEQGLSPRWEEKSFRGKTSYQVVTEKTGKVLQARSQGAASGLVFKKEYLLQDYPILSWRWKVKGIIPKANERTKNGDDYAARVYVIFPHWFFPKTRTISYVWGNTLAKGTTVPSPYTGNAMMVAVESGTEKVGEWQRAKRNVLEDYRNLFGAEPPAVGAIAIMTDTDNTGASAEAWYDDLQIEKP